jgi:hypothetical protein
MTDQTPELRSTSVQEWGAALKTSKLQPGPTFGYQMVDGTWNCALHLAVSSELTSDAQRLLAAELQQAISDTVNRVLYLTPVSVKVREADPMKALTIRQPWSGAIAHQSKRVENRTWKLPAKHEGALGFWTASDDVLAAVETQLQVVTR